MRWRCGLLKAISRAHNVSFIAVISRAHNASFIALTSRVHNASFITVISRAYTASFRIVNSCKLSSRISNISCKLRYLRCLLQTPSPPSSPANSLPGFPFPGFDQVRVTSSNMHTSLGMQGCDSQRFLVVSPVDPSPDYLLFDVEAIHFLPQLLERIVAGVSSLAKLSGPCASIQGAFAQLLRVVSCDRESNVAMQTRCKQSHTGHK